MDVQDGAWWIIDDTGLPKQGEHSVGVARQYCGMLGQQDNCQVAVSVSLTCQAGSLPVAWQLYLPQSWADDPVRRKKAGVPAPAQFATKPQIALAQLERLMEQGAPRHCVLADAGYGVDTAFRERLSALDLPYVVGITGQVTAWPPGHAPLPPRPSCGRGVVPVRQRLGSAAHERPLSLHQAKNLPYPRITSLGAAQRTQRHVPSSITSLRLRIAAALVTTLPGVRVVCVSTRGLICDTVKLAACRS